MNLTLHLVAKDVRHLRRALILWIGLLVGQVVGSYRLASSVGGTWDWFQHQGVLNDLLLSLGLMVTYLLVGMLVLEDPLAGEKMFWVTRPIKGSRLLISKALTALLLFVVLPLGVRALWWMLCDFSARDMLYAAIRITSLQLLFAIPAFAVASVAANIGRFLLMTVLLAMGVFVVQVNLLGASEVSFALRITREVVALVLFGVTSVVGTIQMYRTRRLGRVMVVFGLGLSLTVFAGMKFPVELADPFSGRTKVDPLENSSSINLEIESARLDNLKNKEGSYENYLMVKVRVLNLPEKFSLRTAQADVVLRWPDGTRVQSSLVRAGEVHNDDIPLYRAFGFSGSGYLWPGDWDAETAAKNARFMVERAERLTRMGIHSADTAKGRVVWLLEQIPISEQITAKILKEPPECQMTINVEASVPEVLGEIELVPGTEFARRGRIELLRFGKSPKDSLGSPGFNGTFSLLLGPAQTDRVLFYQIDRQHQAVTPIYINRSQAIVPVTEHLTWVDFDFGIPQVWRTDRWVEVPEWQKDFRIGIVVFKPAGTFDRSLPSERLKLVTREEMDGFIPADQAGHTGN